MQQLEVEAFCWQMEDIILQITKLWATYVHHSYKEWTTSKEKAPMLKKCLNLTCMNHKCMVFLADIQAEVLMNDMLPDP